MSNMPTYLSCIVDDGKYAIGQAVIQRKKLKPYLFTVGETYNFTPDDSENSVRGNVVFTGSAGLMTGTIIAKDTFKISVTLPEPAGDFNVGNIMIYLQSDSGVVFPFVFASMKVPYLKQKQADGSVGNRFTFEFIEKIVNVGDALNMTIIPAEYYSLASYLRENDLPQPSQMLFQQFQVQEPKYSPVPFIGARRSLDNTYWGMPLYAKVGDPFFGVIDGGRAGAYNSQAKFFWGGKLRMNSDQLKTNYGGGSLTTTPKYVIGGTPLNENIT